LTRQALLDAARAHLSASAEDHARQRHAERLRAEAAGREAARLRAELALAAARMEALVRRSDARIATAAEAAERAEAEGARLSAQLEAERGAAALEARELRLEVCGRVGKLGDPECCAHTLAERRSMHVLISLGVHKSLVPSCCTCVDKASWPPDLPLPRTPPPDPAAAAAGGRRAGGT
jgi:hypothetical protein